MDFLLPQNTCHTRFYFYIKLQPHPFEENGWRGFALPLLLQRFSPLKATLILGLLWGLWHFPVKYDLFHVCGLIGGFVYLSAFTLRLTLVSILITYFWNRLGQTTIIAIATHGLINDSIGLGAGGSGKYVVMAQVY